MAKRAAKRGGVAVVKVSKRYAKAIADAAKSAVGAPFWRPTQDGDAVAGKILSASWREFRGKPNCNVVIDTGEQSIRVGLKTVLVREFQERAVTIGSEVAIVYRGLGTASGPGRPPELYALAIVKEGSGEVIVDAEQAQAATRRDDGPRKRKAGKRGGKRK